MTFIKQIENARRYTESDPDLCAYIVRDWDITERAGLKDLAWAMVKQGNNTPNDAAYLLDKLLEFAQTEDVAEAERRGFDACKERAARLVETSFPPRTKVTAAAIRALQYVPAPGAAADTKGETE